jgi:hypothetical protein
MGNCLWRLGGGACRIAAGSADELIECDGASSSWVSALLRHRLSPRTRSNQPRASQGRPHRHLLHVDGSGGEAGDQRRRSYRDDSSAARSRRTRRQPRAREFFRCRSWNVPSRTGEPSPALLVRAEVREHSHDQIRRISGQSRAMPPHGGEGHDPDRPGRMAGTRHRLVRADPRACANRV